MKPRNILPFFYLFFVASCVKQSPQLPSNKNFVVSGTKIDLVDVNKQLILREDSLLNLFVANNTEWIKDRSGFWYQILNAGTSETFRNKDQCRFKYEYILLQGKKVHSSVAKIEIGKKQTIIGIEEGLKLIGKGGKIKLLLPWYLAYGMKGFENDIGPYQSFVCILTIDK